MPNIAGSTITAASVTFTEISIMSATEIMICMIEVKNVATFLVTSERSNSMSPVSRAMI